MALKNRAYWDMGEQRGHAAKPSRIAKLHHAGMRHYMRSSIKTRSNRTFGAASRPLRPSSGDRAGRTSGINVELNLEPAAMHPAKLSGRRKQSPSDAIFRDPG